MSKINSLNNLNYHLNEDSPLITSLREELSISRINIKEIMNKYEKMKIERDKLQDVIFEIYEVLGIEPDE